MALVTTLQHQSLERDSHHKAVDCTYSIITESDGTRFLQIDTYGSKEREFTGKKSQSMRFSPEAIKQIKKIIIENNL